MSHVRTFETVVSQVRIPFRPKHDPSRNLAEEIESCKRKIWECIDPAERKQYFEKKQKKTTKECKIESYKENSRNSANNPVQSVEESKNVIDKPQSTKGHPPPTRTDIELKVFVMKVVELKKELKARGQDTAGLKKDLRTRLINVIMEEFKNKASAPNTAHLPSDSVIIEESLEEEKESSNSMEDSEVVEDKDKIADAEITPPTQSLEKKDFPRKSQGNESVNSMQVGHHNEPNAHMKETELISSEKKREKKIPISVPKKSLKKPESSLTSIKETATLSVDIAIAPVSKQSSETLSKSQEETSKLTESKMKEFSEIGNTESGNQEEESAPPSEVSLSSKASGNSVKDMVSKFSGFSSSLSSSSGGSALSKGLQAKKEARQAKIAEMRAKAQSKPSAAAAAAKVPLTTKEYSNTLTSLNATASTASTKTKNLAAQMREKAAARAFQNKASNSVSKTGAKTTTKAAAVASSSKRYLPFTNNSNNSNNNVPDILGATLKQPQLIKKSSKVFSPMDTYEISDREDSETDDSDSESENEKQKKKIPVWAQRSNLYSALEEQYNGRIGSVKVDPDDIFPEVQSCDLEAIFGPKKSKLFKRRASSGNWANDQVTVAEKLVYKREMGFATNAD